MPRLVLLGDSIFDNARYTSGGPDIVSQVQRLLPFGWSASLLAMDGEECLRPRLPFSVCTIYNGRFPDKTYQRIASVALTIFKDTILRVAIEHGLSVIDLRLICNEDRDYANPIEPSSVGGEKIARVIANLVTAPETLVRETRIVGALQN